MDDIVDGMNDKNVHEKENATGIGFPDVSVHTRENNEGDDFGDDDGAVGFDSPSLGPDWYEFFFVRWILQLQRYIYWYLFQGWEKSHQWYHYVWEWICS